MKRESWHTMLMYPPKLSDDTALAVWNYLNEVCQSFERHYTTQLKRKLDAAEELPTEFIFDDTEHDPF